MSKFMDVVAVAAFGLLAIGAVTLYLYRDDPRCLCPEGEADCCVGYFMPQRIIGIALLVIGAVLLGLDYAKRRRIGTTERTTRKQ